MTDDFGLDDEDIDILEDRGWNIRKYSGDRNGSTGDEKYSIRRRRTAPDRVFERFRSGYNHFEVEESNEILEEAAKDVLFELEGPMNRSAGIDSYKTNDDGRIEECEFETADGFIEGSLSYEKRPRSVQYQVVADVDFNPQRDMTGKPYDVLRDEAGRVDEVLESYFPDMIPPHFKLD